MDRIFDDPTTTLRLFLATIGALIVSFFLLAAVSSALIASKVFDPAGLTQITGSVSGRQGLRGYVLFSNLVPFTGSAMLALWFVYRRYWTEAAGLRTTPATGSVSYGSLFFIVGLPFVAWLAYWNLQLPLPEWMQRSEENTDLLLRGILRMETIPEFLLAFVTIAVTPAIGEELLLRGVVQRRIFRIWFGNAHVAIWAAAVLFSTMHLEFAGFAPRLLLGALLGYAYYWSRSLWVPIVLHLLFNGLQVVGAYVSGEFTPEEDLTQVPPWWLGVASLGLMLYVGYLAEQKYGQEAYSGGDAGAE